MVTSRVRVSPPPSRVTERRVPRYASSTVSSMTASWSAPGIGPHPRPARPPNIPPNRSSRLMSSPNPAVKPVSAVGPRPARRPAPALLPRPPAPAAARLRIGENVVGLGDVLEPVLRTGVLVHVGVVGASQLAVCPLDLVLGGGPAHPQDLV